MARESITETPMIAAARALLTDLSDLLRKEIRLAKAEVTDGITAKAKGGVWMAVAGVIALLAVITFIEAVIFAIAAAGLALYWAALLVTIVLLVAAGASFFYGRSLMQAPIAPERAIQQVNTDITAVREQLS